MRATIPSMREDGLRKSNQRTMKALYLRSILCGLVMLLASVSGARAESFDKEELRAIWKRLQRDFETRLGEPDLMYWPSLLEKFPDMKYLTDNAESFRPAAIALFKETSRAEMDRIEWNPYGNTSALLIAAMYGLPPDKYLEFAEEIVDAAEAGTAGLNDAELLALVSPGHKLTDLFSANYKHPRVRRVLEAVKRLLIRRYPDTTRKPRWEINSTIDSILSGNSLKLTKHHRSRYPREYPNNMELSVISAGANAPDTSDASLAPQSPDSVASASAPIPAATPLPSQPPAATSMQPSQPAIEHKLPAWLWFAGIIALLSIVVFATIRGQRH